MPGSPLRMHVIPDRNAVNVQWLVRLRWAQIVGQALTIFAVRVVFAISLPVVPLSLVVAGGLVSNVVFELYVFGTRKPDGTSARAIHEWQLAGVMALDIALLTAMLYFTGGPLNPFGFLYLVQIALATVLMPTVWTWSLVALSFACFGLLLVDHQPLLVPDHTRMYGMWVALGVASAFIVHFLARVTTALGQRESELTEARNLAARQERVASLATMAAGAAHELATPLSTVALVAKELEHQIGKLTNDASHQQLIDDARLIREQVGRCRVILDQMAGGAGTVGESLAVRSVDELLADALTGVRALPAVRRDVAPGLGGRHIQLPPRAVSQALRSLVTNAQDASPNDADVVVRVSDSLQGLRIQVVDRGHGVPDDVLARLGEPFFTTKAPGRGMGLGLFLARAVFEGVGGSLAIDSVPGRGTTVTVVVPTDLAGAAPRQEAATGGTVMDESFQHPQASTGM